MRKLNTYVKIFLIQVAACVTLSVAFAADHSDSMNNASEVRGPETAGHMDSEDDLDWFAIEVEQSGFVILYTTGKVDTYGTLHNEAGEWMGWNWTDDDDGSGRNFLLQGKLNAGTYFLKVSSGKRGNVTGNYALTLRTHENAIVVTTPNHDASLSADGDIDWYTFELKQPGRTIIYTTGGTDTYGSVHDQAGNWMGWNFTDDDDGAERNFFLSNKMAAGKYYLKVNSGNNGLRTGDYRLSIRSQDQPIPVNSQMEDHSLGVLGDLDFYRFEVTTPGLVMISTTGATDTYGEAYDDAGNWMGWKFTDDDDGAGRNFHFLNKMAVGTYYLVVRSGNAGQQTGDYQLLVRQGSDAAALYDNRAQRASIDVLGDQDLFAFSTTGGFARISSSGSTDTYGTLYDGAGNWMGWKWTDDNDGQGNNFLFEGSLAAGRYFLLVRGEHPDFDSGGYSIHAAFPQGTLTQLGHASQTLLGEDSTYFLSVDSNANWSVQGVPSWLSFSTRSGSPGVTTLRISTPANTTGERRRATVRIGDTAHVITQEYGNRPTSAQITIRPPRPIDSRLTLDIETVADVSYRLESSTDMSIWHNTGIVVQGSGNREQISLTKSGSKGFFRFVKE